MALKARVWLAIDYRPDTDSEEYALLVVQLADGSWLTISADGEIETWTKSFWSYLKRHNGDPGRIEL